MRKVLSKCVVGGVILGSLLGVSIIPYVDAQDAAKVEKGDGKSEKKQVTDRLPRNYGKIGLTEAQRKTIYEIIGRYESQVDEHEKKIAELKAKEVSECEAVLNPNQLQSLKDLTSEAKKKAAIKKKDAAKEGEAKEKGEK